MGIPREHNNTLLFLASLLSVVYTVGYVGILYVSVLTRPRPGLLRDSPFVIRLRVRAVTFITILSLVSSSIFVALSTGSSWLQTTSLLGLWPVGLRTIEDVLYSLVLTAMLFMGPLLERLLLRSSGWEDLKDDINSAFSTWVGWRNYVAAPITEEIVFRACMVPLHIIAGRSPMCIVFATPLYFGIAHIHHAYEFYLNHPNITLAAIRSTVQFTYTTVFGWFATFVFLRTGSIWAVVLVHAFCNWMGVPRLGPIHGPYWMSAVYYACLAAGSWAFYHMLWPLTESPNALMAF